MSRSSSSRIANALWHLLAILALVGSADAAEFTCPELADRSPGAVCGGAADADEDCLDDGYETELLDCFAPRLVFHPREDLLPSSVPWFLERVGLWYESTCGDERLVLPPGAVDGDSLTAQSHPRGAIRSGSEWIDGETVYYEECDPTVGQLDSSGYVEVNESPVGSRFFTRIDATRAEQARRGELATAKVYGHVRPSPDDHPGMLELTYWLFYPYNGRLCDDWSGTDCVDVSSHGAHEGDWEHVTIRVEELSPARAPRMHSMFFATHLDGEWRFPEELEQGAAGQPIVYVAWHSHASYPHAGEHPRDFNGFPLPPDQTAASSVVFDTRGDVVPIGSRGASMPGARFMAFSGLWGPDEIAVPDLEGGETTLMITSPRGPILQSSYPAEDDAVETARCAGWSEIDPCFARHPWFWVSQARGVWTPTSLDFPAYPYLSYGDPSEGLAPAFLSDLVQARCSTRACTLWIEPGSYAGRGVYDRPLRIRAAGPPVRLD